MINSPLWSFSTFILPLFFSIILHEMAHGWVALKLGDVTAKKAGRLTLNPVAHIDPVGSILVPGLLFLSGTGFMFGWAKPVPVNFAALKDPKRDMGLVALAGPLMNFILAILCALVVEAGGRYFPHTLAFKWVLDNFVAGFMISLSLCAFNLFPMLPLDGGRIVTSLLPNKWAFKFAGLERYGFLILVMLLMGLPYLGQLLHVNLDILGHYMHWMASGLMRLVSVIV